MMSNVLVGIQFCTITAIVLFGTTPDGWFARSVAVSGLLLGITSIVSMRPDNLRILPEPKPNARFVTTGPYRVVRHPMYTSVLLFTFAFIGTDRRVLLSVLWIILAVVLIKKLSIEERLLTERFPEYDPYRRRTWKLFPFIF